MKRRDFLRTSMAASGGMLLSEGWAAGLPCSPPVLNVEGGNGGIADCQLLSVPYALPTSGAAVAISTNTAAQVKPAAISTGNWGYSLFNSYGSGSFNPDYSPAGAFVIASTGGHGAPPNVDAVVFDFSTGAWQLLPNANGIAARTSDFVSSDVNSDYLEILAATAGRIPAPSHTYSTTDYLPSKLGGGLRGSFVKIGNIATTVSSVAAGSLHKLDLASGLWTRMTDERADLMYAYECSTVFDPTGRRYYFIPDSFHRANYLQYFDIDTGTIRRTPTYNQPADYTPSGYQTTWLDPVRRLILNQRPGWSLRAIDLNNFGAGWAVLKTSGTQPTSANRWAFFEPDGRFYTRGNSTGQQLNRLTAPSDWRNGTWAYDTVTIGGASLPNFTNAGGNGTRHYGTFFYVSALRSLAWISGESTPVVLLRPPGT